MSWGQRDSIALRDLADAAKALAEKPERPGSSFGLTLWLSRDKSYPDTINIWTKRPEETTGGAGDAFWSGPFAEHVGKVLTHCWSGPEVPIGKCIKYQTEWVKVD